MPIAIKWGKMFPSPNPKNISINYIIKIVFLHFTLKKGQILKKQDGVKMIVIIYIR